jgi:formate dehydrogenase major subunit
VQYPEEYDLLVNNGRLLEHFHEGNLTYKSKGIQRKFPDIFVEVSPEFAKERGIKDGALVRLDLTIRPCKSARARHRPGQRQ